jgi:hypothetical protein
LGKDGNIPRLIQRIVEAINEKLKRRDHEEN